MTLLTVTDEGGVNSEQVDELRDVHASATVDNQIHILATCHRITS